MRLTDKEKRMLCGEQGEAVKTAMEILLSIGEAMEAEEMTQVASVQAMAHFGSLHIAGRDWLEKLACLGGRCCVPTTQDPASIPFGCWQEMGYDSDYAENQYRLRDAILKLGEMPKWSCTPYYQGSLPEKGVNPVFALAEVVRAVPGLIDPDSWEGLVLCTIVQLDAGAYAFGTAASEGVLRMTIRAEIEAEMNELQKKIEELSKAEAAKYGLELSFEFEDEFPETRNDPICVEKVYQAAAGLGYKSGEKPMSRGSEDFGYYTKIVPGAMFYIGAGKDVPSFHTSGYDFTDQIMENAVEMFKALILN